MKQQKNESPWCHWMQLILSSIPKPCLRLLNSPLVENFSFEASCGKFWLWIASIKRCQQSKLASILIHSFKTCKVSKGTHNKTVESVYPWLLWQKQNDGLRWEGLPKIWFPDETSCLYMFRVVRKFSRTKLLHVALI